MTTHTTHADTRDACNEINHTAISRRFVAAYEHLRVSGVVNTKRAFCASIGMHPQNFHPIETGERYVSIDIVCALLNTYDINPLWLITGNGNITI